MKINLDKYLITKNSRPLLIAEISCNHCGNLNLAKKLLERQNFVVQILLSFKLMSQKR